jgi:hypothetical protein
MIAGHSFFMRQPVQPVEPYYYAMSAGVPYLAATSDLSFVASRKLFSVMGQHIGNREFALS